MEPLSKDLMPGYAASLDEQGTLTLLIVTEENTQQMQLPAVAVRALLNLLRREASRDRIGYRKWQKEGSSQE